MKLLQAVKAVQPFLGDQHPYSSVVLKPGYIWGMTPEHGCRVACDAVAVDCAVDGIKLHRILNSIKGADDVALEMDTGRRLKISAGGSVFHIKALPESKEAELPPIPGAAPVVRMTAEQADALQEMAKVSSDSGPLMGVRLTPTYVVAANQTGLAFLWVPALPDGYTAVTAPETIFKGLSGQISITTESNRLWIQEEDHGVLRWSLTYNAEYPDGAVLDMLTSTRNPEERTEFQVDLTELHQLAVRAQSVTPDKVEGFWMTLDAEQITLAGGANTAKWGDASFSGAIPAKRTNGEDEPAYVGIVPDDLKKMTQLAATFTEVSTQGVAVAGPRMPLVIWGSRAGDSMEVLIRQVYVSPPEE